jgi:DNA-binding SARP family transcriptional activator/tetratricopeptide (TPR) repeat protein
MDGTLLRGQLLGRMQVAVDDRPPVGVWPRPTARRLVALLLLAPEHLCSRDGVAVRLFPQLEPSRAGRAVSKALSMARTVLDGDEPRPSVLAADRANIWIADHVRVEVDLRDHLEALEEASSTVDPDRRIERLRAALRVDGPVLVDDVYEDWASPVIDEVERSRVAARRLLARTSDAESDWEGVAAADPADEEACAALVEHRLRAGRSKEAARAVETCRVALEQLGLPLDPDLAAIVLPVPTPVTSAPRWPLIGRGNELTTVLDTIGRADADGGSALLVAGPTGIGKTHLLRHALARLDDAGWTVAAGTSVRDDRLAPFASLRTALLPYLTAPASPVVTNVLLPEAAGTSSPVLRPAELAALADGLRQHLDRLATKRPLVLCLDDIQWADKALQLVVARLAADNAERRWSLLLAARTDEPDAPVPELPNAVVRLALGPLDAGASIQLAIHASAGRDASAHARARELADRAGGHPLFIVELARSPTDASEESDGARLVPERIVELLRRRLSGCSPDARRLTALVAVAGDDATIDVVGRAARPLLGRHTDLTDVVDELERAFLVHAVADRLRLAHPLLRDAAESVLNPLRRAQLHEHVADGLTADGRPAASGAVDLAIARHRLAAFRTIRTASYAATAAPAGFGGAAVAYGLGAAEAAEELFMGALEAFAALEPHDRERLRARAFDACLGLGRVRLDGARYDAAEHAFEAARRLATNLDERSRAWRWSAEVVYRQGDLITAIGVLDGALASLPDDEPLARARLLAFLGWCRFRRREHDLAEGALAQAVELAEDVGDWCVLTECLDRYAFTIASSGAPGDALALFERARLASERCGDPNERAIVHLHHGTALHWAGRPEAALAELALAGDLCDRHGLLYDRSLVHWARAWVEESRGELGRALAERDAELTLLGDLHNDRNLAGCQAHRAKLLGALHRPGEVEAARRAALDAADRVGDPALEEEVRAALASV